ncbi:hypothetical protein TanjilG_31408 [Lupinus angustifolius]|uniref:DUF7780 domain-containing protein n=2 Tax=Lupinus angustifolius TaxID=3871 RepID=A0A1J7GG47_LUPAN|nr:hypothetical protein TanjilG_31408 [Lupinus angustifolius]
MAKSKATTSTTSTCNNNHNGMDFLLVFFPQENTNNNNNNTKLNFTSSNPNNLIHSKTQFTISICILLLFFTLLIFTLSNFEPSISNITPTPHRFLLQKPLIITKSKTQNLFFPKKPLTTSSHALQRMGTLYRRGTRSMINLMICHVADETVEHDFRLFLRLIHRFGVTAKNDVVFLFSSPSTSATFSHVIQQENNAFSSLVNIHNELRNSTTRFTKSESRFELTRFYSRKESETMEPIWGKRIRSNLSKVEEGEGELVLSYGSVLSFDATELDTENSLAGFLERVPLSLRRWACYPMLLGRVKRNFKHVVLVDVKNALIMKDPFGRVRNRSPESVFLFNKKNSDKTRSQVNSAVIAGGARGMRRLCNVMPVEIVRAAMQHNNKKKNSVSDSEILSQLVGNKFMWKKNNNINFIISTESIPEASSLVGRNSGTAIATSLLNHAIIQRNNHDLSSLFKKEICSSVVDSSVYRDC